MDLKEIDNQMVVELPPQMDLPAADELRALLLDVLARTPICPLTLSVGKVERITTAAVQVLLAARQTAATAGWVLRLDGHSPAIANAQAHLGLSREFENFTIS